MAGPLSLQLCGAQGVPGGRPGARARHGAHPLVRPTPPPIVAPACLRRTPTPLACRRPEGEPAPDGPPARCPSLTTLAPAALTAQLGAPPRSDDDVASSLAALRSALEGDAEGTAALEELGVAVARSRAEVEVDDGMLHLARPADFGTPTRPAVTRPSRIARRLTAVRRRDRRAAAVALRGWSGRAGPQLCAGVARLAVAAASLLLCDGGGPHQGGAGRQRRAPRAP